MTRHKRISTVATARLAALAVCLLASGCASTSVATPSEELVQDWRARAEEGLSHYPDANEAQREVFQRSLEAGEVSYEDYHDRMTAFVSCLEGSIVGELDVTEGENYGLRVLNVGFEVADDEATENANWALYERCLATEVSLVSDLYLAQPSATAWYERRIEEYLPSIVACLAQEGHAPPEDSTTDEILALDNDLSIDDMYRTPCLISTGTLQGN